MFYHVPAKELCKDQLPSQDDVLMHQEYLIQQGTMGRRGDKRVKAAILGLAVTKVWKDLGVAHRKVRSVNDLAFKLLQVVGKRGDRAGL